MIAVPFVYFCLLLIHHLAKNKWKVDLASFILLIFTVSGFFSILVDVFKLRSIDTMNYNITPFACLCYLGLLTLCILPFISNTNLAINDLIPIKKRNEIIIKFVAWAFFLYFFLNVVMSWGAITEVLLSDDLSQVRNNHYDDLGEESWLSSLPRIVRLPFVLLNLTGGCSWVFIFFAFYGMITQKMRTYYFYLFIIASFNSVIGNILDAGRSAIAYWVISFIACYIFFLPYMDKGQKSLIKKLFIIVGFFAFLFLALVTISRFADRDGGAVSGTQGSIISYFGQTYINFCFFFDNFTCPIPSPQLVFPFSSKMIMGDDFLRVGDLQELISIYTGYHVGVFYTFLGHIMVTSNRIIMIVYALFFVMLSIVSVRKTRYRDVKMSTCFFYYLYSSVIFLGIFTHYYGGVSRTFSVAFWGVVLMLLSIEKNNKRKTNNMQKYV